MHAIFDIFADKIQDDQLIDWENCKLGQYFSTSIYLCFISTLFCNKCIKRSVFGCDESCHARKVSLWQLMVSQRWTQFHPEFH